jgi:hypothetical protein
VRDEAAVAQGPLSVGDGRPELLAVHHEPPDGEATNTALVA